VSEASLDAAVIPELKNEYEKNKPKFFTPGAPGHLKQEYIFGPEKEWKFCSPMTQSYVILPNDVVTGVHKHSAYTVRDPAVSYNAAINLLNRVKVSMQQTRRVNKMLNTETTTKAREFKLKESVQL
jgi:hypothetical protein